MLIISDCALRVKADDVTVKVVVGEHNLGGMLGKGEGASTGAGGGGEEKNERQERARKEIQKAGKDILKESRDSDERR